MLSYNQYSDEQLAAFLKKGDQFAFTEIFERYHAPIFTFVTRRLYDLQEAEDLVAELFSAIWAKHADLDLKGSFASYLFTAARNRIFNILEHKKIEDRYIDSFRNYLSEGINDTDHLIRSKELAALIDQEIQTLPPKMREVFVLSRKTYLTQKQIAEKLGITEVTVKSHMNHALKILRSRLGSLFFALFI